MAVQLIDVPPLDPNAYTGPTRVKAGVARTGNVTTDTMYGPNGSVEFARWLYVGVTGNVSYTKWDGTDQTLIGLEAGIWHPIFSIKVNSVGTTATNLVWGS
ncbi:TPA: hypothetical protein ACPSKZ_000688 [Legionella anisa]|uniref:spike base protein, RCAP_Rcc01079 family n=1 Tax=Legionella anisa TaxID=28082 RepID=UPI0022436302|nr:hypothetical protein [Legionella anisa]MCW8425614.1 hypothetical protein [Legionella anisa]MCW8448957.1 hypothetical protein [Legionella anisa]